MLTLWWYPSDNETSMLRTRTRRYSGTPNNTPTPITTAQLSPPNYRHPPQWSPTHWLLNQWPITQWPPFNYHPAPIYTQTRTIHQDLVTPTQLPLAPNDNSPSGYPATNDYPLTDHLPTEYPLNSVLRLTITSTISFRVIWAICFAWQLV